jgi:hypothetical protein
MVVVYWANARYTSVRPQSESSHTSVRLPGEGTR